MKKLLFAIAGAASFAAFADPAQGETGDLSWVGFEDYTANAGVVGVGDNGGSADSLWACAGEDGSLVKEYENGTAPGITRPTLFANEANTKYLSLDTNGAELQRLFDPQTNSINVAATGTYIDTLVQFTPSETAPTGSDLDGAKLAIWLGVNTDNNTTNLYVQGNAWDWDSNSSEFLSASQAFALTGKTIEPGTWYRLTVKAIPNVLDAGSGYAISAFQIFVDDVEMTATTAPISSDLQVAFHDSEVSYASADIGTAILANKLIPAIQSGMGDPTDPVTLTSVGFKGTGALDDFVVTENDPFGSAGAIDFTLTWDSSAVTAVSYQIGENEPVAISAASPFKVPDLVGGETVKFVVQNADGAQKTLTGTAGTDAGIDATGTTFGWPEYLGEAVAGAYEIDDAAELVLFQKGVAAGLETASTTFKLTDDVTLATAWPGVGIQNGKDLVSGTNEAHFVSKEYHIAEYDAGAFKGTFDGQNYTISGFQMQGGNLDYCGFFNSIKDATIQNLKIAYKENKFATDSSSSTSESGATFVGVAKSSTLQNLTTIAGSVTDVTCAKGFGGIVGYHMAGTTVESCTNNINLTSAKNNKAGGISMITQGGTGSAIVRNCQNNGTTAGNANQKGGVVGYVGAATTIENCTVTANSDPTFLHNEKQTVTIQGTNKAPAGVRPYTYTNNKVAGLNFATVDNGVATFVADNALALNGEYKVMAASATATYEFAAAGSISFDTNLVQAVTFNVTSGAGLEAPTETTANGVVTFTVASSATPLNPGQGNGETYATEEAAAEAAASVTIAAATEVANALGEEAANYVTNFEAKAVSNDAGGYTVQVVLKESVEDALQEQANADAGTVAGALDAATATVTTMPGFYYSIKYGASLEAMNYRTAGELATGASTALTMPAKPGTSGFYKVVIDIAPSAAVAPAQE